MMARRVRPPHRALRGWLLALPSTGLAIAGHGLTGGGLPDLGITVPLTVLIAWAGAALAERLRGLVALTVALGLIQLGLHQLLNQTAGAHAGHHPTGPAPVSSGWAMFAGHALATVLTAVLLARASSALSLGPAALDWLRGRLTVLLPAPIAASPVVVVISATPARPGALLEIVLRRVQSRRGPPVSS